MKRSYSGTVLWFDDLSGQGMIREHESQNTVWVYACNITGSKSWWEHLSCMSLEAGQVVESMSGLFAENKREGKPRLVVFEDGEQ